MSRANSGLLAFTHRDPTEARDNNGERDAKRLASDHRVLRAAPSYLARHGVPKRVADLASYALLQSRNATIRSASGGSACAARQCR